MSGNSHLWWPLLPELRVVARVMRQGLTFLPMNIRVVNGSGLVRCDRGQTGTSWERVMPWSAYGPVWVRCWPAGRSGLTAMHKFDLRTRISGVNRLVFGVWTALEAPIVRPGVRFTGGTSARPPLKEAFCVCNYQLLEMRHDE